MIHPLFINLYWNLVFLTGILPASRIPHPASRIPHPASALLLLSALICPYLHLSALIYSYLPLSALICPYLLLSRISHLASAYICSYLPLSALICTCLLLSRISHPASALICSYLLLPLRPQPLVRKPIECAIANTIGTVISAAPCTQRLGRLY